MLFDGGEDLRAAALRRAPRAARSAGSRAHAPPRIDLSPHDRLRHDGTSSRRCATGARGDRHRRADAEARATAPIVAGRQGPVVQMEARPAHARCRADVCAAGPRQALAASIPTTRSAPGATARAASELVPVGKSYFGFTDEELKYLDRFVRNHTIDRFGPVREVEQATRVRGRLRRGASLDPPQIRRRHALPAHPPHPLGQAGGGGRPARNADGAGRRRG